MNYYSGYTNHCSPTAATNMVMYWKYGRGFFSGNSTNVLSVFSSLYSLMGTTSNGGTPYANILPAYDSYFQSYCGASSYVSTEVSSVTWSGIKSFIDSDMPIHLDIQSYGGYSGSHGVNVWGYTVSNNTNYLYLSDNWGTSFSTTYLNYSTYNYGFYDVMDLY